MKKGYFFTLDAFLAIGVIIVGMMIISTLYSFTPSADQTRAYASGQLATFSTDRIEDLHNEHLKLLIAGKIITNPKNTILEQIGEFEFKANITGDLGTNFTDHQRLLLEELTKNLIQQEYGVGFYIDGDPIFERPRFMENKVTKILLTSKTPAVGVYNSTALWGPYLIEVRIWQ